MLGPDDFWLGRKGRAKKLAKDLSPEVQKQIERWLDEMDDADAFDRIIQIVEDPDSATDIINRHRARKKPKGSE
jgi:thiamine biosynthesis lipoprotein ApbE